MTFMMLEVNVYSDVELASYPGGLESGLLGLAVEKYVGLADYGFHEMMTYLINKWKRPDNACITCTISKRSKYPMEHIFNA